MSLFQELINHSVDSKSLELFIHANSARFYELLDSHYSVLLDEKMIFVSL
ncbi:MAG: hypothetical protein LUE98_09680 [Tannerellaceae bacterium]|nr:hypothetical protein [Tannerellaceae bacterium]